MHLTILGGGFLLVLLHSTAVGVVLMVLIKIILDMRSHLRERARFRKAETPSLPPEALLAGN